MTRYKTNTLPEKLLSRSVFLQRRSLMRVSVLYSHLALKPGDRSGWSDLGPALTGPGAADGTSREQVWCHTTCKEALHSSEKEVRQVLTSASPGHTCRVCDQEELRLY